MPWSIYLSETVAFQNSLWHLPHWSILISLKEKGCWDLQVTIIVHCIYNVATPLSTLSIEPGKTSSHMHDINDHQRK